MPHNRLNTILEELHNYHPKLIDLSLERVEWFLADLGNPHLKLPPVIHVAGTNGKGSTIAILRSILEAHDHRCHVMTSPHLIRINERIRITGELIDDEELTDILQECMDINAGRPITFFEIMTAATFLAFSRHSADFTLLETGLGGRLDASNVVPDPAVTIITTISHDHQDFLGTTVSAIASEKAGIIKPDIPCILGYQMPEYKDDVSYTIQSKALSTGSLLYAYGSEWFSEANKDQMQFTFENDSIQLSKPNLLGTHQIYNAGAALAALQFIPNLALTQQKISTGLGQIDWPGRLQQLDSGKFNLSEDWEIWIDGGHNDSAGEMLAHQAQNWQENDDKDLYIITAMVNRKDPVTFLTPLKPYVKQLYTTEIPDEESSFSKQELYDRLTHHNFTDLNIVKNVEDAISDISKNNPGRILICGSLYLAGHILSKIS